MTNSSDVINYHNIYTAEELASLPPEKIQFCIKEGQDNRKYINHYRHLGFAGRRAEEIANTARYKNISSIERATLSSLMAFDKDGDFIEVLLNKGVSLKHIQQINAYIPKVKSLLESNQQLDFVNVLEKNITTITKIMSRHFGVDVPHVIINRANYILAYNRELFEQMEKEKKGKSY